jgi:hypothetical protein
MRLKLILCSGASGITRLIVRKECRYYFGCTWPLTNILAAMSKIMDRICGTKNAAWNGAFQGGPLSVSRDFAKP